MIVGRLAPLNMKLEFSVRTTYNTMTADALWPLLLTWFNFNPSMDK